MTGRPRSSTATSGLKRSASASASRRSFDDRGRVAEARGHPRAVGRVLVVVDDQDAVGGRCRARHRTRRRLRRPTAADDLVTAGSGTTNSLPRPAPSLCAATVPPCSSHEALHDASGRARARPARDRAPAAPARTGRSIRGSISGEMPMPLSRDARRSIVLRRAGRSTLDAAARLGVLRRVGQQVRHHLRQPRRRRRRRPGRARGTSTSSVCRRCSSSGLAISIALATIVGQLDGCALAARSCRA